MANILCLETSTRMCSAALSTSEGVVAHRTHLGEGFGHAERLHVFIADLLDEANWNMSDVDAVAVSNGPGSFTGLRIGLSAAKGLAYGLNVPIIACTSTEALEAASRHHNPTAPTILTMLDARRMEVYAQRFTAGQADSEIAAHVVDAHSFPESREQEVLCTGDGAVKCAEVLAAPGWTFEERHPEARYMHDLAQQRFADSRFEDVAYMVPFYLKPFFAGTPKKKPLG